MDRRKIVLLDAGMKVVKELDISEVDHADARIGMYVEVRTRCEMGEWHATQRVELYPWGSRIKP